MKILITLSLLLLAAPCWSRPWWKGRDDQNRRRRPPNFHPTPNIATPPWKHHDMKARVLHPSSHHHDAMSLHALLNLVGGAKDTKATKASPPPTGPIRWFRTNSTRKERALASWLLFWNGIALVDALMFTFRAKQNLDGYLVGEWGPHALAQTRMLANCQLALIATSCLVACIADERALKIQFQILILATLGAFRAVSAGVKEGTVKAPWKTGYAAVMSAPPLLLLAYFAFVF